MTGNRIRSRSGLGGGLVIWLDKCRMSTHDNERGNGRNIRVCRSVSSGTWASVRSVVAAAAPSSTIASELDLYP